MRNTQPWSSISSHPHARTTSEKRCSLTRTPARPPPARRARHCRVRYHFFGLAVVTSLVEDTAGLGPFASLFRGLEFPAEYSSDLLFTLCSNQAPRFFPGPDPGRVEEEALVPRLYRHPNRVPLRSGRPHQRYPPGVFAGADEEVHQNVPVSKI